MFSTILLCKSCQQIWWRVNQAFITFLYITSEVNRYYEGLFLSYRPRTGMQFFTILQDKLHSSNIQNDRRTRFLYTTNLYRIDHIIKRFHEELEIHNVGTVQSELSAPI